MHLSPQQTLAAKQRRAGRREAGHVYDSGRVTLATHFIFSKKFDIGHGHQLSPRNCGLLEDPTMKPSSLHDHSHSDSCRSSEAFRTIHKVV